MATSPESVNALAELSELLLNALPLRRRLLVVKAVIGPLDEAAIAAEAGAHCPPTLQLLHGPAS
jgi:hypothetical protein